MNKKWLPYVLIVVLAVVLFFVRRAKQEPAGRSDTRSSQGSSAPKGPGGGGSATSGSSSGGSSSRGSSSGESSQSGTSAGTNVDRNRGFDRRISYLEYTRHADCRMACRKISKSEVQEIMQDGAINYKKSRVQARPCPEYALEGNTHDGQHVRIVFAQCDFKTKVVTTIDLDTDWSCDCPGDKN